MSLCVSTSASVPGRGRPRAGSRPGATGRRRGSWPRTGRAASGGRDRGCRSRRARSGRAQQDRVLVPRRHVSLPALAERAVLAADPAGEVDREAEGELGDRLGVGRAAAEHVDAAPEAGLVVDVGEEVALDVAERPAGGRPPRRAAGRSGCPTTANARGSAASKAASNRCPPRRPQVDHGVVPVQPLERRRGEDPSDALRRRPQDHDGSRVGVGHARKIPGGTPRMGTDGRSAISGTVRPSHRHADRTLKPKSHRSFARSLSSRPGTPAPLRRPRSVRHRMSIPCASFHAPRSGSPRRRPPHA